MGYSMFSRMYYAICPINSDVIADSKIICLVKHAICKEAHELWCRSFCVQNLRLLTVSLQVQLSLHTLHGHEWVLPFSELV